MSLRFWLSIFTAILFSTQALAQDVYTNKEIQDLLELKGVPVKAWDITTVYTSPELVLVKGDQFKCFAVIATKSYASYLPDPVIAYGTGASLSYQNENFLSMIDGYQEYLRMLKDGDMVHSTASADKVLPMMDGIQWGQRDPYNRLFPKMFDGRDSVRALAGCGPVALAQILKYQGHPASDDPSALLIDLANALGAEFGVKSTRTNTGPIKEALTDRFGFDDVQTTAIVQMQLGKLAGLEKQKILEELQEKLDFIKECDEILSSRARILDIVKTESLNLRDKYSDERRTEISDVAGEVDIEDLIPLEECVITKTVNGYIKRLPSDTYNVQHRGGRGITGMTTREEDSVENMFVCSSHDRIMLFSNLGRVYRIKAYEIPEGSRTSKGMNLVNVVPLMPGEKINVIIPVTATDEDERYICMITRKGVVKRTKLSDFKNTRKSGIIAISIDEGDELAHVRMTDGDNNLLVATKKGKAIHFNEHQVRSMGRTARGVKAINMAEDDIVVDMALCKEDTRILTVTETGYGRISPISHYRLQSRGGKGLTNYKVEKYGDVAAVLPIERNEDIIMIASNGIVIRIFGDTISEFARPAKGVRVMRVAEGERILSVAKAEHDEAEVNDTPEEADADAGAVDSTEE